jgi:hypothetical protein
LRASRMLRLGRKSRLHERIMGVRMISDGPQMKRSMTSSKICVLENHNDKGYPQGSRNPLRPVTRALVTTIRSACRCRAGRAHLVLARSPEGAVAAALEHRAQCFRGRPALAYISIGLTRGWIPTTYDSNRSLHIQLASRSLGDGLRLPDPFVGLVCVWCSLVNVCGSTDHAGG